MAANPNTMTFKTVFSAEYQLSHFKEPVYQILADTRLESDLTKGQIIARSWASDVVANDMGADGAYSTQAIVDTQETLTVNKEKEASIYIKKLDEMQAHLPVKQKYGRKLANALINQIDGDVLLAIYQGAGTVLDDGSFAGTSGNGFTTTENNVATVFTTAMQKLRLNNRLSMNNKRFTSGMKIEDTEGMPVAAVSPEILTYIELYLGGKDTLLGDQVSRNGYSGYFMGFELFLSNALPWTGTLTMATNPSDGDTTVINGVTFTWKTTQGSTAGNINICSSAATSVANLVASINAPGTTVTEATDAGFVALSAANQRLLKNITATDATTSVTIVASGWGTVVVSETLTATADVWTTTKQKLHCIFTMAKKACSLVVQKNPSLEENFVSGKIGRDHIAWTVYGIKIFVDQAQGIVELAVNSSAFTAALTTQK